MRTIHADLLAIQTTQTPSPQPAILAVFTCANPPAGQTTTYNYSFDPTVTTNRLEEIEYREAPFDDYAVIILRNNDLAVPNLVGYYVDLGLGANTASGLRYGTYPRLWVKRQHIVSGGTKEQRATLQVTLELEGVWSILKEQLVLMGNAPYYQDSSASLTGKTIYGMLEYLIETTLYSATGSVFNFTLDPLGDQDDGVINTLILEPTHDPLNPFLNQNALNPESATAGYETFAGLFERLLLFTGCFLRAKDGLAFKVVYPQVGDAINENYYSSLASGHVFYENTEVRFPKVPNRIKVFSKQGDTWDTYIEGEAFSDDYTFSQPYGFGYYVGQYMPVIKIFTDAEGSLGSEAMADKNAKFQLDKHQAQTFQGRTIVPHDARVELYDRVAVFDTRGS